MPNELQELATFLENSRIQGKLIFGIMENRHLRLRQMLLDEDVKEGFRKDFLKRVGQYQQYRDIVAYNPNGFREDEVHKLKLSNIPNAEPLLQDATDNVTNFNDKFIKSIKFLVFRFKNSDQKVVSVFKYYPKTKFLMRHNAYFFTNGTLKFSRSDVIGLAASIDCVSDGENMLVINRNPFEKIFSYSHIYLASATSLFQKFSTGGDFKIAGIDDLQVKVTKSLGKLRRLHNVYNTGSYRIYNYALIKQINDDNDLGITFAGTGNNRTVTFPTTTVFMDVYEDAYLESRYTSKKYLALSKRERSAKQS